MASTLPAGRLNSEWLEADGLGGFASGTVSGIRTRRYHALLLVATTPPTGRMVLVNGLEVWLETPGGRFALSAQRYTPDVIHPDGHRHIAGFEHEPWPIWTFRLDDGGEVTQEVIACHECGHVIVRWRLRSLPGSVQLVVRPLLSGRDYHALHHENQAFDFTAEVAGGCVLWRPYPGVPPISAVTDGSYRHEPVWYRNVQYDAERDRGLDYIEDLASPGVFSWTLDGGDATLVLSAGEASPDLDAARLLDAEARRRRRFQTPLQRAADAYVVRRGAGKTIVAGYPWFTDWGRDTFITLRGFMALPGGLELARDILLAWAPAVSEGMVPNRFPDAGERPEYNAVDASLWYVVAAHELLKAAGARGIALAAADQQLLQHAICRIVAGYRAGTRYGIRMDADGLLAAGVPGVQLTWMDAKVGDRVITPRIGKPVEVQALWLNTLRIAGASRPEYCALYRHALASFQLRFWNDAAGCLYDVVDVDHVAGRHDPAVRPNQILAVGGLPHQVLVEPYASRVVETVKRRLLTPLGLRSLAPEEPGYRPHFGGGVWERDSAYHQGTVWPWLIGPFVEAWLRVRDDTLDAKREADERFLSPLRAHLGVAGLGHVSEIADAEPPHRPGGCPFQAWSLGEFLRASRLVADEPAKEVAQRPRNRVPAPQAERRTGSSPMLVKEDSDGTRPTGRRVRARRAERAERARLAEDARGAARWKLWGPYLSERQWGTVREDYSPDGNAWDYFSHDQARSRAYRWGEDGIAGISDRSQRLCLALALWNGRDPILKERLFGLTNGEGNHGEDVKELYYYLDATPTHSYLKYLYKYPQREFPYTWLVEENRRRGKHRPEFELIDTGVFDDDRYFDVFVEYAKATPEDILMHLVVHNRGPEAATIHVLPQLWFRNLWSWRVNANRPDLYAGDGATIGVKSKLFGGYALHADGEPTLLFCDNDTNVRRLFGVEGVKGHFKDAFHEYLVASRQDAVNPAHHGTKAGVHYRAEVPGRGSASFRLRLARGMLSDPFADFDEVLEQRRAEADEFYGELQAGLEDADARSVQRQAFAGMIWGKQFFHYDVTRWLEGDPTQPPPPESHRHGRNSEWRHLNNYDIISMPDKWEYPWYAAWDLAFHCIPLALIDAEFAKQQLIMLTREWYMHPNGQLPAYEWAFSDVNPPVHGWAAWRVFQIDRKQRGGEGDLVFLERVFHKLLLNFTWWVNRKDAQGRNVFQGGFLGLDNIGVFDRSASLPTGGYINQADGTAWMAMYCLNLMRIALELAQHNHVYEDIATKFFEHFLFIAEAMTNLGGEGIGLWDEEDQFFYDELNLSDRSIIPLKVRSMVGLIPLFAVETLEPDLLEELPEFSERLDWFLKHRPGLAQLVSRWHEPGLGERRLLSLLRGHRMKALLRRMLDETEFLSDYGVRALSKYHEAHPYVFDCAGVTLAVKYLPAESDSGLFGGNSNWRGPIWFPVNYLLIESLQKFHHYYGDDFKIECPTGSGNLVTIEQVAEELSRRLTRIFLRDEQGRRPVFGDQPKLQHDPNFRDHVLFYEYFHGDSGRGLGASHQTGWTGVLAKLLQPRRRERA